jgi:hypothetical protein
MPSELNPPIHPLYHPSTRQVVHPSMHPPRYVYSRKGAVEESCVVQSKAKNIHKKNISSFAKADSPSIFSTLIQRLVGQVADEQLRKGGIVCTVIQEPFKTPRKNKTIFGESRNSSPGKRKVEIRDVGRTPSLPRYQECTNGY